MSRSTVRKPSGCESQTRAPVRFEIERRNRSTISFQQIKILHRKDLGFMKKRRPHCSLLPDVEIPMPKFAIIRHFLLEEGMETVEEGFTITKAKIDTFEQVLISNFRGTELTEAEETKDGWDSTTEDVLDRALDELKGDKDPLVEAVKFLLNVIEHQEWVVHELTSKPKI